MFPLVHDATSAVQFVMFVSCTIMGLSHMLRPQLWVEFFDRLHAQGTTGVVTRTFMLELWPAMAIVALHQVWWGPGIWLTIYGWAQLAKVTVAMLSPEAALRSMAMARRDKAFLWGGLLLLSIAASAGAALIWPVA